jgi:uncharacterized protein YqgC (DUF456 family)
MTIEPYIGLTLAVLLMGLGTLGSVLPGIPSTPLVMIVAIAHRLYFGEHSASTWVLVVLGLIMLLSIVMDYLASMYGAKKMGATWRGVVGALVGATVGLFFGLIGIVLGTFAGALLFELAGGRENKEAMKAGVGATLGLFAGALGKLACCGAMMGLFLMNVIYRTWLA